MLQLHDFERVGLEAGGGAVVVLAACGGRNTDTAEGLAGGHAGVANAGGAAGTSGVGGGAGAGTIEIPDATGTGGGEIDVLCLPARIGLSRVPVDLFLLIDKSESMNCQALDAACRQEPRPLPPETRWTATMGAIKSFLGAPASAQTGVGIGIGFFPMLAMPMTTVCDATSYAEPAIRIAPLPFNEAPLRGAVDANHPFGARPTTPALEGAISYAKSYLATTPQRSAAVV